MSLPNVVCSANGSYVATLYAADKENDPFVFEQFQTQPPSPFLVDPYGVVTVNGWLDFATTSSYVIAVSLNETITRACPFSNYTTFTITVLDAPDAPLFTLSTPSWSLPEESRSPYNSSGVATLTAVDPTASNTSLVTVAVSRVVVGSFVGGVAYSQLATSPYFDVVSSSGAACTGGAVCFLRVSPSSPRMDYDTGLRSLTVTLTATGATGLATPTSVTVAVVGYNEPPWFASTTQALSIAENSPDGAAVGNVTVNDAEGDVLAFVLLDGGGSPFALSASGQVIS